ncbi:apolipoprotein N-acyltransferase [Polycladidibacter stylochi]|uniref:apolipoprotein N-acyltransferase n=1 Tax=Polycladidibacter stylochi TaxID=1807766 RepID=UPI0008370051|nr:apolipoprotein N-acyltransferase [Pseudovibrio stylochi]
MGFGITLADKWARPLVLSWGVRRLALAALMGALSALAFPPFGLFPVLWLTLPSYLWLLDSAYSGTRGKLGRRWLNFFYVSLAFSTALFVASLWWIAEAFLVEADKYAWMIPLAVLGLPLVLALIPAIITASISFLWRLNASRFFVFIIALALADFARATLFTGFPWNLWSAVFAENVYLLQFLSIGGTYSLSALVLFIFSAPAAFINVVPYKAKLINYCALASLIALWGFGYSRVTSTGDIVELPVEITVIQPNIAQKDKWAPAMRDKLLPLYLELTQKALLSTDPKQKQVVIWPESVFPFVLTQTPEALQKIAKTLPPNAVLVAGAIRVQRNENTVRYYNSVYALDTDANIIDVYDKVHLVPFGEYLPYGNFLTSLGVKKLVSLPEDFSPGLSYRPIKLSGDLSFQPLVCYEAIFPETRLNVTQRPDFIANLTNDAWFGSSAGPYQHLSLAKMRAVEQGIPLVRAANTGISAAIDIHGNILEKLEVETRGFFTVHPVKYNGATLYARWGNYIFGVVILGFVSFLLVIEGLLPTRRD